MSYEPDMLSILETLRTDKSRQTISWLPDRVIFLTRSGSTAYGTNTPSSDVDFKGICIEPPQYYQGFNTHFEQADWQKPDAVVFSLRKFFKLAADCNPNIIEMLYTDERDRLRLSGTGLRLMEARDQFLSQKAMHTFSGYAMAQLKRIKNHYAWHTNPPDHEPTRAEFDLPRITLCPFDQLEAAEAAIRKEVDGLYNMDFDLPPAETIAYQAKVLEMKERVKAVMASGGSTVQAAAGKLLGFDANFLVLLDHERAYKNARLNWEQYQGWKKNRNVTRAKLEKDFGYDTKHGMHLVRLLRMGREILQGKGVVVRRPDAEELLAIRGGSLTYEQLVDMATREELAMRADAKASLLPHHPDRARLDDLCISLYDEFNHRKE